ncbi:MAG TPA: HAD-IIA family hydrolase [Ignavibacteriaceae bacterium]|nr:HAD-IIA family hydrolase [Ignavibacteriaceae bacterium]
MIYENYNSFIFDLDGTIYRGEHLIENADKTINLIKESGRKIIFVSNKTTETINDYYNLLTAFGLNISEDEIINSTFVLKKYLLNNFQGKKFFAIGERKFVEEIIDAELEYSNDPDQTDIVLITLDRTFNYDKLEIAARALENGARFFAANIDDTCPVDNGEVLDAGATISALEKRTHRKLEMHFGKPSDFMIEEIISRINGDLSKTLLTGDRIETDIKMGITMGIDTALVKTGVKLFRNGNESIKPTYHINSVFDLINR